MTTTLAEFLVEIKARKENEEATRRLTGVIREAGIELSLLVAAVEGAVKTFARLMIPVSEAMKSFYYEADRTRTSTETLRAMGFAASQTGSSFGDMRGEFEKFSVDLRSNVGLIATLKSYGIETRKVTGEVRDFGEMFIDLVKHLNTLDEQNKIYQARLWGISIRTLDAVHREEWDKRFLQERQLLQQMGVGEGSDAEYKAAKFSNALQRIWTILAGIEIKFEASFIDRFGTALNNFGDYLIDHGQAIADTTATIANAILSVIDATAKLAMKISDTLSELNLWKPVLAALGVILAVHVIPGLSLLSSILTGILGLVARLAVSGVMALLSEPALLFILGAALFGIGIEWFTRDSAGHGYFSRLMMGRGEIGQDNSYTGAANRMRGMGGSINDNKTIGGGLPGYGGITDSQVQSIIREEAAKAGVDPSVMLGIYHGEGRGGYYGDHGKSFGPFQLYTGGGMGNEIIKAGILTANELSHPSLDSIRKQAAFSAHVLKTQPQRIGEWHGYRGHWAGSIPQVASTKQIIVDKAASFVSQANAAEHFDKVVRPVLEGHAAALGRRHIRPGDKHTVLNTTIHDMDPERVEASMDSIVKAAARYHNADEAKTKKTRAEQP